MTSQIFAKFQSLITETKSFPAKMLKLFKFVVSNTTIEPIVFLVQVIMSIDLVAFSQLLVDKSCANDFNFTKVYMNLVNQIIPVFIIFFLGSWSDVFGRKIILYIFFATRIFEGCMMLMNIYNFSWPKEYLLIFVSLPLALTGGFLSYYMTINAFIADIVPPEQRSFRMAILYVVQTVATPFGTQIGKFLFDVGSYECLYWVTLFGRIVCMILIVIRMETFKFKIQPKPDDISKSQEQKKIHLLSPLHIKDSFQTALKKRTNNKRFYLWVYIIVVIGVVLPLWGETVIGYNYVMTRFDWGFDKYSNYITITQIIDIVGQIIMLVSLGFLKIRDSFLVPILLGCIITRDLIKAFAEEGWMYYLAAVVYVVCGYIFPATRSLISACVEPHELGKVFALMTAMESLVPMGMSQIYASVWKATSQLESPWVGSVFMISAALNGVVLVLSIVALIRLKGRAVMDLDASQAGSVVNRTTDQQAQMPNNHTEPDDPGDKGNEVESEQQSNLIDI